MKKAIKKIIKSATDGKIKSKAFAKKNPKTTYLQTVTVPSSIKKKL